MSKTFRFAFAALTLGTLANIAWAQSFNIDIGQPGAGPPGTYAAAGLPGHWISVPATQSVQYTNLVNIHGVTTLARMNQIGGTQTLTVNDPALTGDHANLMNDFLITHTTVENCLFFNDMQPGEYEILVYARMPAQPTIMAQTNVDQEPGNPDTLVGGVWTGQHVEGVTYSRHFATVAATGPSAGKLGLHSGVPPGGSFAVGAALNAVQIRKIEFILGDLNGNGLVNADDLLELLAAWGECPPKGDCAADIAPPPPNGDALVNVDDLLVLLANWG